MANRIMSAQKIKNAKDKIGNHFLAFTGRSLESLSIDHENKKVDIKLLSQDSQKMVDVEIKISDDILDGINAGDPGTLQFLAEHTKKVVENEIINKF